MNPNKILALLAGLLMAMVAGCNKEVVPPPPLPLEQIPSALEAAFASAQPAQKQMAAQIVEQVRAKDYTKAYFALQALSTQAGLTKEQAEKAAGGLLTLNTVMQTAVQQGDTQSAEALKFYRENK